MEDHQFLYTALSVFSILTLSTLVFTISKKIKLPFAVGLLFTGIFISYILQSFYPHALDYISFSPEMVFYVFLPTLIFESSYDLNFRSFRGVLKDVISLATLGLIISITVVASGLHYLLMLDWTVSLLFGALISATDPVAILAIFKEMKTPSKLTTLVDGESLINDGTALVLFQVFLGVAIGEVAISLTPSGLGMEGLMLLKSIILGILVGGIFGLAFAFTISKTENKNIQLTLSLVLAHLTFLIAEGLLGVSGILATMVAGLIMGNIGGRKLKPSTKKSFHEIWSFLGFISNALIFILLGFKIAEIDLLQYWKPIFFVSVLTIFLARPISVFTSFWITNGGRKSYEKVSLPFQMIVTWGGLRGALAAAAVLLIPESYEHAELLQAMTAGTILATFLINALSLPYWIKKLGIINYSKSEEFQKTEAELLVNEEVCQYLDSLSTRKFISPKTYKNLKHQYLAKQEKVSCHLKKLEDKLHNNTREFEKIITQFALGIEKNTYQHLFDIHEIYEERFLVLEESIYRQKNRLKIDILPHERSIEYKYAPEIPSQNSDFIISKYLEKLGFGKLSKKCFSRHRKYKIISRLQHYRARRIASWKVVSDLERLQENHRVFRNPIVKKVIEQYKQWNLNAEGKMAKLEVEFPKTVEPYRMNIAKRECITRALQIEKSFYQKGLINQKVYEGMCEEITHGQRCMDHY